MHLKKKNFLVWVDFLDYMYEATLAHANLELGKKIDPINIRTLRYNVYYVSYTESKLQ